MIHQMRLNQHPFEKVRSRKKDIELRLNDEKRRQLHEGDEIEFLERDTDQRFRATIVALHHAPTFEQLLASVGPLRCGFEDPAIPLSEAAATMQKFYSPEEEKQWGVVGIELNVL